MKSYERRRVEFDQQIDRLLETAEGRRQYWDDLAERCEQDSMISLLESTLHLPGDVIECGVYRGTSVQKIGRILATKAPEKCVYACDSFEGFPEDEVGRVDVGFFRFLSRIRKKFRMCADTPGRLQKIFSLFNIRGEIVKGYFSETLGRFKDHKFCFIHLDCDIYSSYMDCLNTLYDNLVPGGVVVFDDYRSPKWPGAEKAVNEFFADHPEEVCQCTDRDEPSWYLRKSVRKHQAA
ncbi:MAG: class I SAM-dependent methyltransferase [Planctomycetaceae bacterium]|nr:class I SAM-dependent methyltransferase [Planctomycetaceae bacterium]